MSAQSNIAIEGEMRKLLDLLDREDTKILPAEEQLKRVRREIEATLAAAKSGWL